MNALAFVSTAMEIGLDAITHPGFAATVMEIASPAGDAITTNQVIAPITVLITMAVIANTTVHLVSA